MASEPGRLAESKIVLIIEYDGAAYQGFQLQARPPTIQDELEKAVLALTGEKKRVITASRTDSGVHACGQVVAFRTGSHYSSAVFMNGLNHYLPPDIAVKAAYRVPYNLNIRKEAISREYKYYILNRETRSPLFGRYSYRVKGALDLTAMNEACALLTGEHDFISFASALEARRAKNTRRTVFSAGVGREGDELVVFEIVANSFLTHQVRNTVGSLIRVGQGRLSIAELKEIMEAKRAGTAGPSVPACGLFLIKVNYPYKFEEIAQ